MATFLSSPRNAAARATTGELRVAERLEQFLEDDYLCWYDVPVGPRHQHPDFVVLHPGRGILVLEVKDWKIDQIREVTPKSFTMDFGNGHETKVNPYRTGTCLRSCCCRRTEAGQATSPPHRQSLRRQSVFP